MSTISLFGTLVDIIRQNYELSEILDVSVMPSWRSRASDSDRVYHIVTASSSFVLRPFRTEVVAAIELHNRFLSWAEKERFPLTQRISRTRTGADYFEIDGSKWWLSSFVEADVGFDWTRPTWSNQICNASGRALLMLHRALHDFGDAASIIAKIEPKNGISSDLWGGLVKRLVEVFPSSPTFVNETDRVVELVSNAVARIEQFDHTLNTSPGSITSFAGTNRQLIHGDFHPGNLLFWHEKPVAIIDFEYLSMGSSFYDLAYSLVMFCSHWSETGSDCIDGSLDAGKMQNFMNGYLEAAQLPEDAYPSFELLQQYMQLAAAICLTWFLEQGAEDRTVRHFVEVVKELANLSTMDFLQTIGKT